MSQAFKSKYDQLHENDPTGQNPSSSKVLSGDKEERYDTEAHARNLCFVQLSGRRIFLNYGYLISGEYEPSDNMITLAFTSHTIVLSGQYLEPLFYNIMQYMLKQIIETDSRYNPLSGKAVSVVNQIRIETNE